jgi:hypothetical protein
MTAVAATHRLSSLRFRNPPLAQMSQTIFVHLRDSPRRIAVYHPHVPSECPSGRPVDRDKPLSPTSSWVSVQLTGPGRSATQRRVRLARGCP